MSSADMRKQSVALGTPGSAGCKTGREITRSVTGHIVAGCVIGYLTGRNAQLMCVVRSHKTGVRCIVSIVAATPRGHDIERRISVTASSYCRKGCHGSLVDIRNKINQGGYLLLLLIHHLRNVLVLLLLLLMLVKLLLLNLHLLHLHLLHLHMHLHLYCVIDWHGLETKFRLTGIEGRVRRVHRLLLERRWIPRLPRSTSLA